MSLKQTSHIDSLQQAIRFIDQAQKQAEAESVPDNPFMRAMRDYFEAEGCVLLFYENANKSLVTKKEISHGPEWRVTSGLEFNRGLLFSTYEANQIQEFTGPTAGKDYFPRIDGVKDVIPQFIVCGPIQNHVRKFGIVALVNPHNYFINTKDKIIFQLFLSSLANQYYTSMIFKEMRAVDEDLHVSRLQLLNSRNALRSLFDSIPDSLYMVDQNYRLKAVNLSRAKRVKKAPRDLAGKLCYEVFFGLSSPCINCLIKPVFETGTPGQIFGHTWPNEASQREWDIKCYPVLDAEGKVENVFLLEQDVTDKRKMEEDLIQNTKLVAIGQLAAGVAHEINNPLTSILANSQMLLLDIDPKNTELVESVTLIEMAARRATKVVENLQSMVRKEKFEFQPIDLNESLQNALMLVSHEFMSRQISIRFTPGTGMPPIVASGDHLQGVWINLLMNAIEAIDSTNGEIKIATLFDEDKYYVEIKDNGAGISEENLGRIFEPFFSTKRSGRGTGLGLSMAKRIIQAHDGQILVESAPGQGSRFTIILPSRTAEQLFEISQGDLGLI